MVHSKYTEEPLKEHFKKQLQSALQRHKTSEITRKNVELIQ